RVEAIPGTLSVHTRLTRSAVIGPGSGPVRGDDPHTLLTVGTCDTLRELAEVDSCAEGDVFRVAAAETNDFTAAPEPGTPLRFATDEDASITEWALPATAREVAGRLTPNGDSVFG